MRRFPVIQRKNYDIFIKKLFSKCRVPKSPYKLVNDFFLNFDFKLEEILQGDSKCSKLINPIITQNYAILILKTIFCGVFINFALKCR